MRAVLDANVLVSGLLSPKGVPGALLRAHAEGDFELVVSPTLLRELERALSYSKLRRRIAAADARSFVRELELGGGVVADATAAPPVRSADPADDYLVALAARERCALVSGDGDLLALADRIPAFSPRDFLDLVRSHGP